MKTCLFTLGVALFVGCEAKKPKEEGANIEESAEVSFLTNGVEVKNLVERLGPPAAQRKVGENTRMDFLFREQSNQPPHTAGVVVWEKDGKVYKHSFINGSIPFKKGAGTPPAVQARPLTFRIPAGEITMQPQMLFPTSLTEEAAPMVKRALVELSPAEGVRFSEFTRTNVGNQAEVFSGPDHVAGLYIREIKTNSFELDFGAAGVPLTVLYITNRTGGNGAAH